MAADERREIVVVGAGLLGLATARALLRAGSDVACCEAAAVGHEWSGSKGDSRIFRLSYDDPMYVEMARRSLEGWRALERDAGATLLRPCGLLAFGEGRDDLARAMAAAGAVTETLDAAAVESRFPAIAAAGPAVLDPTAGVLMASRALAAFAAAVGPALREGTSVLALREQAGSVLVETSAGTIEAGTVVVCAGPGTGPLLEAAGIACHLRATLEQVAYFAPVRGPEAPGGATAGGDPLAGLPAVIHRTGSGDVDRGGRAEHLAAYGLRRRRGAGTSWASTTPARRCRSRAPSLPRPTRHRSMRAAATGPSAPPPSTPTRG